MASCPKCGRGKIKKQKGKPRKCRHCGPLHTPAAQYGVQPDPDAAALVTAAAIAQEIFGDDELEQYAREHRA